MLVTRYINRIFSLRYLGMIVPCFYGILLFIYSSNDITNPNTPTHFQIIKDLILIAIIIKGTIKIVEEGKLSKKLFIYLIAVFFFTSYLILNNFLKDWTKIVDFVIFKNYLFYISGVMYVYIYGSNFTENYLRKLLFMAVLLGYFFMLNPYLSSSIFMYQGRSISTFLNPNFFGYILSLQVILILININNNNYLWNFIFLSSSIILIATTKSISSLLLILILMVVLSINIKYIDYRVKYCSRIILLLMVIALFWLIFPSESDLSNKITYLIGLNQSHIEVSTSLEGRTLSYISTWTLLTNSIYSMLFGSNEPVIFEWDSGSINILYNYGVIGFFLWILLFIIPIFIGISSFKFKPYTLSIFIIFSFLIFYSTQYVTQFYPTNFIISIIIGLILFHSDCNKFTKTASK